jgi:hypothetical protein
MRSPATPALGSGRLCLLVEREDLERHPALADEILRAHFGSAAAVAG